MGSALTVRNVYEKLNHRPDNNDYCCTYCLLDFYIDMKTKTEKYRICDICGHMKLDPAKAAKTGIHKISESKPGYIGMGGRTPAKEFMEEFDKATKCKPVSEDWEMKKLMYENQEGIRHCIRRCQKQDHVQQVAYSTYHDSLTQICFTCRKVRTNTKDK